MSSRNAFLTPVAAIVAVLTLLLQGTAVASPGVDKQRELFRQVYADVERGNWESVEALSTADRSLLREYVLWPDLRAAWYRATLGTTDRDSLEAFLDQHGTLKPARELRYSYALHLADAGQLDRFLRIYQAYYQ